MEILYLPVSKVFSDKNTTSPRDKKRQKQGNFHRSGKLAIHGCKMTGRVKTDLGECNLKITWPDGECSEILVSIPEITVWKVSATAGVDCTFLSLLSCLKPRLNESKS